MLSVLADSLPYPALVKLILQAHLLTNWPAKRLKSLLDAHCKGEIEIQVLDWTGYALCTEN